ncbi:hypothetical protein HDV00_010309 [Rhizophlyctis rosea]|nr:hypothetical protein HDV00_010309 [Rhizophlyctis rosea]
MPALKYLALLCLAAIGNASPLTKRAVIAHDAVVGFPQTVPSGTTGSVYLAYKPYFGGLAKSGSPNGGCSFNLGQVYVRGTSVTNHSTATYALMYSWYMPKDSPSSGLGHRHEWEGVIVFLKSSTSTAASNIAAVCPSAHGEWNCSTNAYSLKNSGPLIMYVSLWPVNHQMALTAKVGGQQPLIAWESLTSAARNALQTTDFGDATVPFKESTFAGNLAAATF